MQSRVFRASVPYSWVTHWYGQINQRPREGINRPIPRKKIKFAETMVCVYQTGFGISVQGKLFTFLVQPKWLHCSHHSIRPFNPVFY